MGRVTFSLLAVIAAATAGVVGKIVADGTNTSEVVTNINGQPITTPPNADQVFSNTLPPTDPNATEQAPPVVTVPNQQPADSLAPVPATIVDSGATPAEHVIDITVDGVHIICTGQTEAKKRPDEYLLTSIARSAGQPDIQSMSSSQVEPFVSAIESSLNSGKQLDESKSATYDYIGVTGCSGYTQG